MPSSKATTPDTEKTETTGLLPASGTGRAPSDVGTPDGAAPTTIARLMATTRLIGAGTAAIGFAALELVWGWSHGLTISALTSIVFAHALWVRRRPERPPVDVLLIDTTVIAIALAIIEPPLIVLVPPAVSVVMTALLTLPTVAAALVAGYAMLALSVSTAVARIGGMPDWSTGDVVALTALLSIIYFPHMAWILRQAARAESDRTVFFDRLEERENRYRKLYNDIPVGVYRTSPEGQILEVNETLVAMMGYPSREVLLATPLLHTYVDPTERAAWVADLLAEGVVLGHERRLRRYDGSIMWVRDSGRPTLNAAGEPVYYDGTLENVTDRVQLAAFERAIAACARALITENSEEAVREGVDILLEAADVDIVFIERNFTDPALGLCSRLVYRTTRPADLWFDDSWATTAWTSMPSAHESLSNGRPFTFEVEDLEGLERKIYEASSIATELDVPITGDGGWLGLIALADVKAGRVWSDTEIALLTTVAQLIASTWDRENQRLSLERLVQSRDEFVTSVSHRLRTPLTAVVGASSLLRDSDGLGPEERAEMISTLAEQSLEVANVIEDLFVASRTDSGPVGLTTGTFDLRGAVDGALAALPITNRPVIDIDETALVARADEQRVRQILRNLLDNATRYGGDDVSVRFSNGGSKVRIDVRDNGTELPLPEHLLFEPFERAYLPHLPPGQLGLGLTISRRLARMMDGDVTYRRQDGLTVFCLELPRA